MLPVLLLDVDGVLNAVNSPDILTDYISVCAYAEGRRFPILYNPEIVKRLRDWHDKELVEIRWLTTWCDDADRSLAEAIGMPRGLWVEGVSEHRSTRHGWWKSEAARKVVMHNAFRQVFWCDDDLDYALLNGEVEWMRGFDNVTWICPITSAGLTHTHLDIIERKLEKVSVR